MDNLLIIFQSGNKNKFDKMSAAKMREHLQIKYPARFSIPGETEIKTFIGAQHQKSKYKKINFGGRTRGRSPAGAKNNSWEMMLQEIV